MPLLSARLVIPVAAVILAWAAVHALGTSNLAVAPAVWPSTAAAPTPSRVPTIPLSSAVPSAAAAGGGVPTTPILPGALQQLNSSTRDTAVGLYALIQQLEQALGAHLRELAQQLEPGR